jgi:hypothetical protein
MFESLQDVVVTLVAAGAATVVVKRVLGFTRAQRQPPACAACETGTGPHAAAGTDVGRPADHPLVVLRSSRP